MIAPERRQASTGAGEQLTLIDPPPFCPTYPKRGSLPWRALSMLLAGKLIDHGDFIDSTESWRLAAAVHTLRKSGWPVESIELPSPTEQSPSRVIALYKLSPGCIAQAAGLAEGGTDGQ
jgi:hypothetical protein